MKIRIIQGGQTGVDRGAWLGALDAGLARGGWMPRDMRDERGPIPPEVADDLIQHSGGLMERTRANARDADAVICIVEDATQGIRSPGTRATWRLARQYETPCLVIDGTSRQLHRLDLWLPFELGRVSEGPYFSLMVAGPRASVWPDGEATARRVVQRIAEIVNPAASSGHRSST